MGGFLIVDKKRLLNAAEAMEEVHATARAIGFSEPLTVETLDHRMFFYPKIGGTKPIAFRSYAGGDFAFCCGTLIYSGKLAAEALDAIYQEPDPRRAVEQCLGHFSMVIMRNGQAHVLNDSFGGYHVYYSSDFAAISTVLLFLVDLAPQLTVSTTGIYEYVFNGVVSGDATLFNQIQVLAPRAALVLSNRQTTLDAQRPLTAPRQFARSSWDECRAKVLGVLDTYFESVAGLFGDRVYSALSGGYDSRLLLALMRRHHITPGLYVYGRPQERDVSIARHIAEGENLPLDVVDKAAGPAIALEDFPALVRQSYFVNDGYPWGGLFNNGVELLERSRRAMGGRLVINGGGGEILRNFFYLPSGRYTPREILWSFYSHFDPAICTDAYRAESYYQDLEGKIFALVGAQRHLERPTVEWLYHNFRCRSWDGRVNGINSRFGFTVLPFEERCLTDVASTVPLRYKNHGAFEADLIRAIDPKLAAYPSDHGYDFSRPPSWAIKLRNYATYLRPPRLRPYTFRLKHRRAKATPHGGYLAQSFVERVLPGGLELVRQFFKPERIADSGQMNRVLTLEYFFRRIGRKLKTEL